MIIIPALECLLLFMLGERGSQHLYFVYVTVTWNFCLLNEHNSQVIYPTVPPKATSLFFPCCVILGSGVRTGTLFQPRCQFQTITILPCCSFENHSIFSSLLTVTSLLVTVSFFTQDHLTHLYSSFFPFVFIPSDPHIHRGKTPRV